MAQAKLRRRTQADSLSLLRNVPNKLAACPAAACIRMVYGTGQQPSMILTRGTQHSWDHDTSFRAWMAPNARNLGKHTCRLES